MIPLLKPVCLVSAGLNDRKIRLQPWKYLVETACQLARRGHPVTLISDAQPSRSMIGEAHGLRVQCIPDVNMWHGRTNLPLQQAVRGSGSQVMIWHIGLPSFVHQKLDGWPGRPVVGVFPGLVYRPRELWRLGWMRLAKGYSLSALHVIGAAIPRVFLRRAFTGGSLRQLVVQSRATKERLVEDGLPGEKIHIIRPGVDRIWNEFVPEENGALHPRLGFSRMDYVVLYFGSPEPLRGLHTLLQALEIARRSDPAIKLAILSRRRADELVKEDGELRRLLSGSTDSVHMISGFLSQEDLVRYVAACDLVALPFELVPADAPLSLYEVQALGKPLITTRVYCLPEMVSAGQATLVEPADPHSLAQALLEGSRAWRARAAAGGESAPAQNRVKVREWSQVGEEWSQLIQSL
jgi:glycosyltransferase involved in cell wall biosynthesis